MNRWTPSRIVSHKDETFQGINIVLVQIKQSNVAEIWARGPRWCDYNIGYNPLQGSPYISLQTQLTRAIVACGHTGVFFFIAHVYI